MCRRSSRDGLGVTLSEVYGVATFYSQFSLQPKGEYVCGVCLGTACYVKGSQKVLDKLCSELGVEVGQTSKDGRFTVQATRCLRRVWPGARHDDKRRGIRPPDAGGHSGHSGPSTAPPEQPMRDLSMHVLDIAQNSIKAGAALVTVTFTVNENRVLTFSVPR